MLRHRRGCGGCVYTGGGNETTGGAHDAGHGLPGPPTRARRGVYGARLVDVPLLCFVCDWGWCCAFCSLFGFFCCAFCFCSLFEAFAGRCLEVSVVTPKLTRQEQDDRAGSPCFADSTADAGCCAVLWSRQSAKPPSHREIGSSLVPSMVLQQSIASYQLG